MNCPPSKKSFCPVMYLAASVLRKRTIGPTSATSATYPSGISASFSARLAGSLSSNRATTSSEAINPGMSVFTRILGANSRASHFVMTITPAFEAQ